MLHTHVREVPNHAVELAICNLHLLPRAMQAGLDVSDLEPTHFCGAEAADEQCAWYVDVYVRAGYGAYLHEGSIQPGCGACHMQPEPTVPCCASWLGCIWP